MNIGVNVRTFIYNIQLTAALVKRSMVAIYPVKPLFTHSRLLINKKKPNGKNRWATSFLQLQLLFVQFIRFRCHDKVILVQPFDHMRPPRDRNFSPLCFQGWMVILLLSNSSHFVRKF